MTTSKDYIYVRRELFSAVLPRKEGDVILALENCPRCSRHMEIAFSYTETGSLNGAEAMLDYIECDSCHIRLYPTGGSFTMTRDPIYAREWAEHDKMAARLADWWRHNNKRDAKEKRRVNAAVKQKMVDHGPVFAAYAWPIVKSLCAAHVTPKGRFHRPEIYILPDVAKIDDLPAKIVDIVTHDRHSLIEFAWERRCAQPPHALGAVRYNKG
jgi:hypothetical protein